MKDRQVAARDFDTAARARAIFFSRIIASPVPGIRIPIGFKSALNSNLLDLTAALMDSAFEDQIRRVRAENSSNVV
jgi:hypothetical protein